MSHLLIITISALAGHLAMRWYLKRNRRRSVLDNQSPAARRRARGK